MIEDFVLNFLLCSVPCIFVLCICYAIIISIWPAIKQKRAEAKARKEELTLQKKNKWMKFSIDNQEYGHKTIKCNLSDISDLPIRISCIPTEYDIDKPSYLLQFYFNEEWINIYNTLSYSYDNAENFIETIKKLRASQI